MPKVKSFTAAENRRRERYIRRLKRVRSVKNPYSTATGLIKKQRRKRRRR